MFSLTIKNYANLGKFIIYTVVSMCNIFNGNFRILK